MNKFLVVRKENCKNCNKIYIPKSNNSKYCSNTCANKVYYKRRFPNTKNIINKKFNCLFCKTEFINKSNNQKKYCSSSCKDKITRKSDNYKKWYKKYIQSKSFKNNQKKYYYSNKAKLTRKKYFANNKNKINEWFKKWRKTENGKRIKNYDCALRYANKKLRTPKWITKEELIQIKKFYLNRPEGYEVDHIIPLCGRNVSGLHTICNLQYLKAEENRLKNNKFETSHG